MSDSIQSLTLKKVSLEHLINDAAHNAIAYTQLAPELIASSAITTQLSVTLMCSESELSESTPVSHAVHSVREFLQNRRRSLQFQWNDDTGLVTTTVLDTENQKVIRKIPLDQALKLIT